MLTGEYLVLDGALALALPTKQGQTLTVNPSTETATLDWKSFAVDGHCWFETSFHLPTLDYSANNHADTAHRLQTLLQQAQQLNPSFLKDGTGLAVSTHLEFPNDWGLGSSSTLLHLLAQWAQVDAFTLSDQTFGGSGYDIACANNQQPILYQRKNGQPIIHPVDFMPSFHEQLYFVHLGKKQNSREGIAHYRQYVQSPAPLAAHISKITEACFAATTLADFETLLNEHEQIIARTLHLPTVKSLYFSDYSGSIKSLGAWGGDFVLVTGVDDRETTQRYFADRGYTTFIPYQAFVLSNI